VQRLHVSRAGCSDGLGSWGGQRRLPIPLLQPGLLREARLLGGRTVLWDAALRGTSPCTLYRCEGWHLFSHGRGGSEWGTAGTISGGVLVRVPLIRSRTLTGHSLLAWALAFPLFVALISVIRVEHVVQHTSCQLPSCARFCVRGHATLPRGGLGIRCFQCILFPILLLLAGIPPRPVAPSLPPCCV
jgi:hypothetical protein